MTQQLSPVAVWNASDPGYGAIQPQVARWLESQGIPVDGTYRVEVYPGGLAPFARIFTYAHDARGYTYFDHETNRPAVNPVYEKLVSELPPAGLVSS